MVETITPGAAFSDDLLDASRNTFVAAIVLGSDAVGFAAADLSTGEFRLVRSTRDDLDAVLACIDRRRPEVILAGSGFAYDAAAPARWNTFARQGEALLKRDYAPVLRRATPRGPVTIWERRS